MRTSPAARSAVALVIVCLAASVAPAQKRDRAQLSREAADLRAQLRDKENEILEPEPEDRAAYSEFLSAPDTGIIRLLPRETYDKDYKTPDALTISGGGAYYSFALRSQEYGRGADIGLENGRLMAGGFAGADYGFMVSLGDVPIESVTLDHPAVTWLRDLETPDTLTGARAIQRMRYAPVVRGEYTYTAYARIEVATTYVFRCVAVEDTDVLVVARTIRKDTDGSYIMIWKLLRSYPVHDLVDSREPTEEQ